MLPTLSTSKLIGFGAALVSTAAILALVVAINLWPFGSSAKSRDNNEVLVGAPAPKPGTLVTQAATPVPGAETTSCGPDVDGDYLGANQILSYYGNPHVPAMGILGQLEPDELVAKLREHAGTYDALNGPLGVRPALHFVHATAQPEPGPDGLYLQYEARSTLTRYINLACQNGLLIFIDLQIGRSDVTGEVEKVLPYLGQSHVHLALDPEFTMPPGEVPGETIGTMDAAEINEAQEIVQRFVEERGLPDKVLVVHRFTDEMITRSELIEDFPNVRLVIDMDGFGPAEIKQVKYGWYAAPAEYSGIKLFFQHDPDLMSEEDVLTLQPDVIIYQ
jgi:hypothetical protein